MSGEAGGWLRIAWQCGQAFVDGSLLAAAGSQATPEPEFAAMQEAGERCHELANEPGCFTFEPSHEPSQAVTWSGARFGGVAVGAGALEGKVSGGTREATGTLVRGGAHGRWVEFDADGAFAEGP